MKETSLNGLWTLSRLKTGETYPATVPGVVHTDLMAAGVIDRPYYRDNETKLAWIGEEDWAYQRDFTVGRETLAHRTHHLVFAGLDTFATIVLNGVQLGETENMFRRYEFEVSKLLRVGRNEIKVVFASAKARAEQSAKRMPFKIPYTGEEDWCIPHTNRNLIRKCQCHAGWDWGPCFLTAGIWQDVTLVSYDTLKIDYVKPLQHHHGGRVQVRTVIYVEVAQAGIYDFTVSLAGQIMTRQAALPEGQGEVEVMLELDQPELWWPLGYGEQKRHELAVTVIAKGREVAEKRILIGLRQVELVREKDEYGSGESFYFKVNGTPIFLKGYNWIPIDSFTPRMTREGYADLIDSAALAHCNVLRVWGGGIYENEVFYELCDEKGLLVWQDFMFACAMYPWDDAFLSNVAQEVTHQLRRLACHPCLILWCGNNENEAALNWYEEVKVNRDRFVAGYHQLYLDTIGRLARQECPDLPYWPSSPSNGPQEYGNPNDPTRGDVHYWEVWHGGKRFSEYLTLVPRLASEFGFQSVPSIETLLTAMEPEDLNISSPMMDYHQRSRIGNRAMVEHMMYEYQLPLDFASFVYLSQVQQAMAMKIACEHWRRSKPVNMGTIIWQLNDLWPVNSWSSIEYGGKWKVLHYFSKRFYAPVLLSMAKNETGLEVWATSDLTKRVVGSYRLEVWNFAGEVLRSWPGRYDLAAGESKRVSLLTNEELAAQERRSDIFLVLRGEDEGDGLFNWEFLVPAKFCPLPKAKVSYETREMGAQTRITLVADRPAFHVWLEAPGRRGVFSDNAFLLLPRQAKTVVFSPRDERGALGPNDVRVIHLRDTY